VTSPRIEIISQDPNEKHMLQVETQFIRLRAFPPTASGDKYVARVVVKMFDAHPIELKFTDDGKFHNRLAYASAAARPADDPIAFPTAALTAARHGSHSSGLGYEEIEAVVKRALSEDEFKIVESLSKSMEPSEPSLGADWTARLETIASQAKASTPLDVGSKVRQSRAYPAPSGNSPRSDA
jgi:hypothetical protein